MSAPRRGPPPLPATPHLPTRLHLPTGFSAELLVLGLWGPAEAYLITASIPTRTARNHPRAACSASSGPS